MPRTSLLVAAVLPLVALTGCAAAPGPVADRVVTASRSPVAAPDTSSADPSARPVASERVEGTIVRFTSARTSVDVTIDEDDTAVRDLLSRLPLELTAEEFGGREKIAVVPGGLEHAGSPGSDPEDGDLIYFTPWGNLGFYYDAAGVGFSDQTVHIGTFDASRRQLDLLDGPVRVAVAD